MASTVGETTAEATGGSARAAGIPTIYVVFVTAALMGGNYVALKEALEHTSPLMLSTMRSAMGGTALLGFALLRGQRLPRSRPAWKAVGASSAMITTASSVLLVLGTARITSGLAALLASTMPLFATVMGVLLLSERPDRGARLGLAVGVVGAAVIASPAIGGRSSLTGMVLMLLASAFWGTGLAVQKRLDPSEMSAQMFVGCQLLLSCACIGVVASLFEGTAEVDPGWALVAPLFLSAVVCMALPFSLVASVLRRAPAYQSSAIGYLIPLFGVLAAWVFRNEGLVGAEWAGGALVIAGVVLVSWPRGTAPQVGEAERP